jgi:hypothetical protein
MTSQLGKGGREGREDDSTFNCTNCTEKFDIVYDYGCAATGKDHFPQK